MLPDFRLRQRDYLLNISQAMSSQLDLPNLLKLIIESAVELLAGQAGLIVLRQDSGGLSPAAAIGLPRRAVPLFEPLWRDIPPDAPNAIPDISLRLALASKAPGVPLRQVVALPLTIEEENRGYIFVSRARAAASFTENDNQVLHTFANHAAIAVQNAYLYRQVSAERERLNAIIENSGDGVMIINPYRIIKTWNTTLANLTGVSAEEAIGRPCYDILNLKTKQGVSVCHNHCPILTPPENGQFYVEGYHERPDGLKLAFADNYSPQANNQGEIYQFIANVRDVTRLHEADDLKETLLAVISHELKTPVSIIKGYAGTLAREDANWDRDTLGEGLAVIEEEADRLNTLITNFLEASRLQTGNLKLQKTEVFIPDLARSAVDALKATTTRHRFEVDFPPDFPPVPGDYERLNEVLTNLLGNAIKYSPQGGRIAVGGKTLPNAVHIYVSDEGIGIPPAEQERIFERFHRVDNSLTRKAPGTGLGLFLVKAVVEAHGGSVWVQSKPGAGSTFWLELPR
ncbi:MAG: ATP-binding protein [Anaerolineae bacterium]